MQGHLKIYAAGAFAVTADESPRPLKAEVHTATGLRPRRLNRMAELALIGSHRCIAGLQAPLDGDTGVYLSSALGSVGATARMLRDLLLEKSAPMPFAFINVSSNMAGFSVAQTLNLSGSNLALSRQDFPFEAALELAWLDLAANQLDCALVGAVDECAWPLDEHRLRLGVAADTPLAEGSSWLLVGERNEPPLAELRWLAWCADEAALRDRLASAMLPPDTWLAGGTGVATAQLDALAEQFGLTHRYDYLNGLAYLESHAAWGIARFILDASGRHLLHINRDRNGRYCALLLGRC